MAGAKGSQPSKLKNPVPDVGSESDVPAGKTISFKQPLEITPQPEPSPRPNDSPTSGRQLGSNEAPAEDNSNDLEIDANDLDLVPSGPAPKESVPGMNPMAAALSEDQGSDPFLDSLVESPVSVGVQDEEFLPNGKLNPFSGKTVKGMVGGFDVRSNPDGSLEILNPGEKKYKPISEAQKDYFKKVYQSYSQTPIGIANAAMLFAPGGATVFGAAARTGVAGIAGGAITKYMQPEGYNPREYLLRRASGITLDEARAMFDPTMNGAKSAVVQGAAEIVGAAMQRQQGVSLDKQRAAISALPQAREAAQLQRASEAAGLPITANQSAEGLPGLQALEDLGIKGAENLTNNREKAIIEGSLGPVAKIDLENWYQNQLQKVKTSIDTLYSKATSLINTGKIDINLVKQGQGQQTFADRILSARNNILSGLKKQVTDHFGDNRKVVDPREFIASAEAAVRAKYNDHYDMPNNGGIDWYKFYKDAQKGNISYKDKSLNDFASFMMKIKNKATRQTAFGEPRMKTQLESTSPASPMVFNREALYKRGTLQPTSSLGVGTTFTGETYPSTSPSMSSSNDGLIPQIKVGRSTPNFSGQADPRLPEVFEQPINPGQLPGETSANVSAKEWLSLVDQLGDAAFSKSGSDFQPVLRQVWNTARQMESDIVMKAAQELKNPELALAYEKANQSVSSSLESIDSINRIIKSNPQSVGPALFKEASTIIESANSKNKDASALLIDKLPELIGEEGMAQIKSSIIEDIKNKYLVSSSGDGFILNIDPKAIHSDLFGTNGRRYATEAVFGKQDAQVMEQIIRLAQKAPKSSASSNNSSAIGAVDMAMTVAKKSASPWLLRMVPSMLKTYFSRNRAGSEFINQHMDQIVAELEKVATAKSSKILSKANQYNIPRKAINALPASYYLWPENGMGGNAEVEKEVK